MWVSIEKGLMSPSLAIVFDDCNGIIFRNLIRMRAMQQILYDRTYAITLMIIIADKVIDADVKNAARYQIFAEPGAAREWVGRMSTGFTDSEKAVADYACMHGFDEHALSEHTLGEHANMRRKLIWDNVERRWRRMNVHI